MLRRHFEPQQPHRYVRYGRMSTDMQNPRSPEQQFDTIEQTRKRHERPWVFVRDYRDDGVSGRYFVKRVQFQQMIRDVKSGTVDAQIILVDTFERFGRSGEASALRLELQSRFGILVLTADSDFADPTTTAGQALTVVESIRSTEDGRIKAHNVLRGKRDLASRGFWPGGPMPFGYRLKNAMVEIKGREEIAGRILVPDPVSSAVPPRLYALALEKGWGTRTLARALNADPAIPQSLKPISAERVRHILENTVYTGVLTYGRCCTGIINDRLIRDPVHPDEHLVVPDFCEPLVDRAVAEAVWAARRAANQARPKAKRPRRVVEESEWGPRIVIPRNHLLTGLVRCGECDGSMRVFSSTYRKNGNEYRYAYYSCWRHPSGQCGNEKHVREDILREAVIAKLRSRLFPPPDDPAAIPGWLPGLSEKVRRQIATLSEGEVDPRPGLRAEMEDLGRQLDGWSCSLNNPNLPAPLRSDLEGRWNDAHSRRSGLEKRLTGLESTAARVDNTLDPSAVLERLRRLAAVLAGGNIVEGSRELGRHIDRIVCLADGRVELRTHCMGLFDGLSEWFPSRRPGGESPTAPAEGPYWSDPLELVRPRRRARAVWSTDHAEEVLAKLEETGWTVKRLTEHFERSRPTIDTALKVARQRRAADPQAG